MSGWVLSQSQRQRLRTRARAREGARESGGRLGGVQIGTLPDFKVNAQCSAISVLIKSFYLQYAYDM